MRIYPDTLTCILKKSELNVNQISKITGISNTYITKLVRSKVNHPGKDKIASLLLALNYSITDINAILAEYDYMPLNEFDIPSILENNRRRKFEGRIMPHFDHIYFELVMAALEGIGGTKIVLKHRPSGIFIPIPLYLKKEFPIEEDHEAARFFMAFTKEIVLERKKLFLENCKKGAKYETYICRHCMEESLAKNIGSSAMKSSPEKVELFAQYFANAVSVTLKYPEQHYHQVVRRCGYFEFMMQDAEGENCKISFTGRRHHFYHKEWEQLSLQSFLSDAPGILSVFHSEVDRCREAVEIKSSPSAMAQGFHDAVREQFDKHQVVDLFDRALESLMKDSGLIFF
ncbi:hypothetical protein MTBBW1_1300038 [Desulfamplus magnetovallimortis]|uniref:Uncharacterized protein n=1 Tax=Desulfamplus magnetovallimortis TaxID=1246637 RepID=A0A1W1H7E8_9BACT|nr:hypothetical protein [Desulfamplus magnetovallimortis]SLM28298.1 hypothetical protein MTBBW1_1300038 [Desulfamplus magnetovallimortis]